MKLLFLPGLDGSGLLFHDLILALPKDLDISVIALDQLPGRTYAEQARDIALSLQGSKVFLVAESYSGPLAFELCNILGAKVTNIVFIASFISPPSKVSEYASLMPVAWLKPWFISRWLLNQLGFSGHGNRTLLESVFGSLAASDKRRLTERLDNIANLNAPSKIYLIPAVYIQPSSDRLVNRQALEDIQHCFPTVRVQVLAGGHFIAQQQPVACAQIILQTFLLVKRNHGHNGGGSEQA